MLTEKKGAEERGGRKKKGESFACLLRRIFAFFCVCAAVAAA